MRHPGEFIKDELKARNWTQADLARIMERPLPTISLLVSGKKRVTAKTATELAAAFGTSAEMWMNLQSAYDLKLCV